jgi:enoyl-CoA hydratase/carnithine racemase
MSELVHVRHERGIDLVVLDSPHNRNALSLGLMEQLLAALQDSASSSARALALDHAGPVFCSGIDLRERRELGPGDGRHSELLAQLLGRLWTHPAPVACRVDGPVRGGGMGLVACGDIVVASSRASFAYSEVKVGVAPALVGAVALAKTAPGLLAPWLLTGEPFDAAEARRLGLVARVADGPDALAPELDALRSAGPGALRTVKRIVRDLAGADVEAQLREMAALSATLFDDDEAREGMAAFAERRPPAWASC